MTNYLSYQFTDNEEFISTFDELPLWSASFGLLLLKHVELKRDCTVIDLGSGTGFPLIELAGRLGCSCKLYGIDPWVNANKRTHQKIKNYGYSNVEILETSAEHIPLDDGTVNLIVSNLGINNFDQPPVVFKECHRVLKTGGKLALTTNLNGHWKEFYTIFAHTLQQLGLHDILAKLKTHQEHRGSTETISKLFTDTGFKVTRHIEESFEMRFADGSAFLNHHFVKLGWLGSWKDLLPQDKLEAIFSLLEKQLNDLATKSGGLTLTIPMAFIEGEKC
jgi:arsenite methyltransferase